MCRAQLGVPTHLAARSIRWDGLTNVPVRKDTAFGNYAEARRHQHDCKLLDGDGELFDISTPLEHWAHGQSAFSSVFRGLRGTKVAAELKPLLGASLTAYLKGSVSIIWALWLASLLSVPISLACRDGGVLTGIGYGGLGASLSLGNIPPWSVAFFPLQAVDMAGALLLLVAFTATKKTANRLASEMSRTAISPADFSVYITDLPPELGATHESEEAAIQAYTAFFKRVCERPAAHNGAPPPPEDHAISEMQLIKGSAQWLRVRRRLAEAEVALAAATDREQHMSGGGVSGGAAKGGGRKTAALPSVLKSTVYADTKLGGGGWRQRLFGWAAKKDLVVVGARGVPLPWNTSTHWSGVVDRLSEELTELEEMQHVAELSVVGALVTFNCADAARKVVHELGRGQVAMDYEEPPDIASLRAGLRAELEERSRLQAVAKSQDGLAERHARLAKLKDAIGAVTQEVQAKNWMVARTEATEAVRAAAEFATLFVRDRVTRAPRAAKAARAAMRVAQEETRRKMADAQVAAHQKLEDTQKQIEVNSTAQRIKEVAKKRAHNLYANLDALQEGVTGKSLHELLPMRARAPAATANRKRARLQAVAALEPSDYIWEHLTISRTRRVWIGTCGWVGCLLVALAAVAFDALLVRALLPPPLEVPGVYTLADQKCADISYLRATPHAAARCGLGAAGINPEELLTSILGDACDEPLETPFSVVAAKALSHVSKATHAAGADATAESDAAVEDAAAAAAERQFCSNGGGKLGNLLALTKCWARIDGTAFSSYADWRMRTESNNNFKVSDKYGMFLPACAFLGEETEDGLGGFVVQDEVTAEDVPMFCAYGAKTSSLPYTMDGQFHCEAPLYSPETTAGVSESGGLADVVDDAGCDEPNCLRCVRHYAQCLAASRDAYPQDAVGARPNVPTLVGNWLAGPLVWLFGDGESVDANQAQEDAAAAAAAAAAVDQEPDARRELGTARSMTPAQVARARAIAAGALIGIVNTIIPTTTSAWVRFTVSRHVSRAEQQATRLRTTYFILVVHTLLALHHFLRGSVYFSTHGIAVRLGFFPHGAELGYAAMITYGLLKQLSLWLAPGVRSFLLRRVRAPRAKTQAELNSLFTPTTFAFPATLAYTLNILTLVALFSTPMPLVLPIAAAFLTVRFWTERVYLLTLYAKPAPHDAKLMSAFAAILYWIIALKIISMAAFYGATRGGKTGAAVLWGCWFLWYIIPIPAWLDATPFGMLFWRAPHADAVQKARDEARLANRATHQALRARGEILAYDPLAQSSGGSVPESMASVPEEFDEETLDDPDEADGYARLHAAAPGGDAGRDVWGEPRSVYLPFVWTNAERLHLITTCPNSHEIAHPHPDDAHTEYAALGDGATGSCWWERLHRLGGAEHYMAFDTWPEARKWMETTLRVPRVSRDGTARDPAGACADELPPSYRPGHEVGERERRGRYTYVGLPTLLVAPPREGSNLDGPAAAPAVRSDTASRPRHKWVVGYTKERSEFANLKWRLLEAASREALTKLLDAALRVGGKGWVVQCVAAEIITPADVHAEDEALARSDSRTLDERLAAQSSGKKPVRRAEAAAAAGVRWVAVLRAGGTEATTEWATDGTIAEIVQQKLMGGLELDIVSGTPAATNARLLTFVRLPSSWAAREVAMTAHFPTVWLAERMRLGMLLVSMAYCGESWSMTVAQGEHTSAAARDAPSYFGGDDDADDADADDGFPRGATQAVLFEPCWPPPDEARREVNLLLEAGYRLTSLVCGPRVPALTRDLPDERRAPSPACTYVAVFTRCTNGMAPRELRACGSLGYTHRMEYLLHERRFHADWTKYGMCTVHATSTAPPNHGTQSYPRAAFVIDGDEATCWRSRDVPTSDGDPHTEVSLTIDLGQDRPIDRILLFWGTEPTATIPARAALLVAPAAATTFVDADEGSDEAAQHEAGMRAGEHVIDERQRGVEAIAFGTAPDAPASGPEREAARRRGGGYVEGESCNVFDLGESPRRARFVQLRLSAPPMGAHSYALRNVYILGPRTADAASGLAVPTTAADETARESMKRLLDASGPPPARRFSLSDLPPPPKPPREASPLYQAMMRQRELNQQTEARLLGGERANGTGAHKVLL